MRLFLATASTCRHSALLSLLHYVKLSCVATSCFHLPTISKHKLGPVGCTASIEASKAVLQYSMMSLPLIVQPHPLGMGFLGLNPWPALAGAGHHVPLTSLDSDPVPSPAISIELGIALSMAQSRLALSEPHQVLPRAVSLPPGNLTAPPYTSSVGSRARRESVPAYGPPPFPAPPGMRQGQAIQAALAGRAAFEPGEWGSERQCLLTSKAVSVV